MGNGMYARVREGVVAELCADNPHEIFCRELADSFFPCGEELYVGDIAVFREGALYRDAQSMALREETERRRAALAEAAKSVRQEGELLSLLELLAKTGLSVAVLTEDCEVRLKDGVEALCEAAGADVSSGELTREDIEKIKEALYHGGN